MKQSIHAPARLARRLLLCAVAALAAGAAPAQPTVVRIGTGGEQGTYFPVGTLIARGISADAAGCQAPVGCGVPGLLAVAQLSNGSVSNVEGLGAGVLEAALVQADVAYWAWSGTGLFEGRGAIDGLSAVATLYPESVHVVARSGAGIRSLGDLSGKRVSLDEPGSGTLVDARLVLHAYDLDESSLEPVYLKPQFAAERIGQGLDAFFFVGGYPAAVVTSLIRGGAAHLVPLQGEPVRQLVAGSPWFRASQIPEGVYPGQPETPTVSVAAQLLVRASLDESLVYALTRELWSERTGALLRSGHPKGAQIRAQNALDGVAIPLHRGAERYYREAGLLR